ncbi:MAG: winged helix-turn-helix domain-containing protein [Novosphingobium sp.]
MRRFRWLGTLPVPSGFDLRRQGWALDDSPVSEGSSPALTCEPSSARAIVSMRERARTLLIGVDDSLERAEWLQQGFGDVLPARVSLGELEMRAARVRLAAHAEPRRRRHGALELDLLTREGTVKGKRLGLHPREFSLLWRLAQTPGRAVSPQDLLAEVWQMTFKPETNSLAVHVCRLRAKLAAAGLAGIVSTTPDGGYALVREATGPDPLRRRLAQERHGGQSGTIAPLRKHLHET